MMEECGELIQRCSKCIRFNKYEDDEKLTEEIGDVYAMIDLMVKNKIVTWAAIYDRAEVKKNKLKQWSDIIQ